jgi:hypothetical protein
MSVEMPRAAPGKNTSTDLLSRLGEAHLHVVHIDNSSGGNMTRRSTIALMAVMLLSVLAFAADDPFIGTWKLNPAKSKFSSGPALKSQTLTYEPSGNGVKLTFNQVDAQGNSMGGGYTANYEGKDYPFTSPDADTIALKRIDASTVAATWKKTGKVTMTSRRTVSKDGKTLTIAQKGKNAQGQAVNYVSVYDKQ